MPHCIITTETKTMRILPVLVFLLYTSCRAEAYTFLLVPIPLSISHCLEIMGIGRALAERGHNVHLLYPDFADVDKCVAQDLRDKINVISFKTDPDKAAFITTYVKEATDTMAAGHGGHGHVMKTLLTLIPINCDTMKGAPPALDQHFPRGSSRKPDMVVVDGVPFGRCLTLIPAYLGSPWALTGSFISTYDSGMPWPVTSYPIPFSDMPGQMTFVQRLKNALFYTVTELMVFYLETLYVQGDDFGPDLADFDYGGAMRKAVLFLENSDYILDYPKATFPNFVQVGGLTTGPAKPLPEDLQKYFDSSRRGVVIVSMGSMLFNTTQQVTDKLLSAAARVKGNVVLRLNVDKAMVPVPENVKLVTWFPQNDALGHPNTRVFLSHCGKNGFYEGLYHAVPILCVPVNADGFGTGRRVSDFGAGGSLDLKTVTAEELGNTINAILENSKIREKMQFYSKLFHERPETPPHRAASALEHVIKNGGDHLRPHTTDLNFAQYTGVDVFAVLMVAMLGVVGVSLWVCFAILRCIARRLCRSSDSTTAGKTDSKGKKRPKKD